jgi:hypothetical protein
MEIFSIECEWLDNRVSTSTELANSHGWGSPIEYEDFSTCSHSS